MNIYKNQLFTIKCGPDAILRNPDITRFLPDLIIFSTDISDTFAGSRAFL